MKLYLPLVLLVSSNSSFAATSKSKNLIRGNGSVDTKQDTTDSSNAPSKDEQDMDPEEVGLTAKELDLSLDDAKLLLSQQQDFAKIADFLEEDVDFLHVEMPLVPDGKYTIMYKGGNIPSHRLDEIETFKAKHERASVEHVASKRSLKEAEDRVGRLSDKLTKEGGYAQATFSIHGDAVKVVAKLSTHDEEQRGGRVLKSRASDIFGLSSDHDDLDGLEMFVVEHDGEDIVESYSGTYGGEYLLNESSWPTHCTSGFTVENISDGMRGVVTAGHCVKRAAMCSPTFSDPFHYDPDGKNYNAYCADFHIGDYGDMAWLTTLQVTENPEFYVSSTKKKQVTSVAQSMNTGQVVCGYSRVNDTKKCKPITSSQVSVSGLVDGKDGTDRFLSGLYRYQRLVSVCGNPDGPGTGDFMGEGDSGSPWWRENTAYGITTGAYQPEANGPKCLLFTKAKLFPNGLNVRVLTA